jgi:tetratricopeptide (TPR) repeat protein
MEARDYALAERLYEEVIDLVPTNPFEHVHLARLYDRMGRGRDALKKYRTVVKGSPGAWSSLQSDPSLLARYGDLCSKFGPVAEAATAYMSAVESSDNRVGQNGIQIAPPDRTLLGLRAAAHVAAGAKFRGQGDVGNALREYDLALAALPNWWVALTFRGEQRALRVGMEALARSDFARAESLATGADRELVRKSAKLHGVITGKSSRN